MCCKTKPERRHPRELQSRASSATIQKLHSVVRTNMLRRPHAKVRSRSNTLKRTSLDLLHSHKTRANTSHSDHHLQHTTRNSQSSDTDNLTPAKPQKLQAPNPPTLRAMRSVNRSRKDGNSRQQTRHGESFESRRRDNIHRQIPD